MDGYARARWNDLRRTTGATDGELSLDRIRGLRTLYRARLVVDGITVSATEADPLLAVRNAFDEVRRRLTWRAPMMNGVSLH